MEKFALLIGVSEYGRYLTPLPTAIKDAEALREVLVHPEMGDFTEENVKTLYNPSQLDMGIAIHNLFSNCQRDDLVLFFFSGHGVTDEKGKLYLSTRETRKNESGNLITPTSIAASFIHEQMSNSRSKRQVVILDSCFSAAFAKGWGVKDDYKVNIKAQLGGKGRAVLTSLNSTQYSLYQAEEELSIYTRYLVEGIRTGAADTDDDGYISIAELHEYARKKVAEVTSDMTLQIFYIAEEGHWIYIATTLAKASRLKFQRAESLKAEFNHWLDIVFKYEAEKKINLLIKALSNSLADGLIQDSFVPHLEKWCNRSPGYFSIADLDDKIVTDFMKWIDGDKAKNLVQEQVNNWVHDILDTLKHDIAAIAKKYHINFEEFQNLLFDMSNETEFDEGKVYTFGKSPAFDTLSKSLFFQLRGVVSIFEGLLSVIISVAVGLLLITVAPGVIVGTLIGLGWVFKGSQDLPSTLTNMLTNDSTAFKKTDLPMWIRKGISNQDISKQAVEVQRKLKDQISTTFRKNPISINQIIEEAIPEIKQSFSKNLEKYLNKQVI